MRKRKKRQKREKRRERGERKGRRLGKTKEEEGRPMGMQSTMLRLELPLSKRKHPERKCPVGILVGDQVILQSSGK